MMAAQLITYVSFTDNRNKQALR